MIFETIVLSVIVVGLQDFAAYLTDSVVVRNVFLQLHVRIASYNYYISPNLLKICIKEWLGLLQTFLY